MVLNFFHFALSEIVKNIFFKLLRRKYFLILPVKPRVFNITEVGFFT
jgi:hypothetical protein